MAAQVIFFGFCSTGTTGSEDSKELMISIGSVFSSIFSSIFCSSSSLSSFNSSSSFGLASSFGAGLDFDFSESIAAQEVEELALAGVDAGFKLSTLIFLVGPFLVGALVFDLLLNLLYLEDLLWWPAAWEFIRLLLLLLLIWWLLLLLCCVCVSCSCSM